VTLGGFRLVLNRLVGTVIHAPFRSWEPCGVNGGHGLGSVDCVVSSCSGQCVPTGWYEARSVKSSVRPDHDEKVRGGQAGGEPEM